MARPSLSTSEPRVPRSVPRGQRAAPSTPADLDPVEASATPIEQDPFLRDRDELRRRIAEQPMVLDPRVQMRRAADAILSDEAAAMRAERMKREEERRIAGYAKTDAEIASLEAGLESDRAKYDEIGRLRTGLGEDPTMQRGRYDKLDPITGRVVPMSAMEREAASAQDFRGWADQEPGSARQAQYNPQGYAEWQAARDEERQARAAADQQKYGVASGENWRDNITDEQWDARADRAEADRRQSANNIATRAKVQGTQNYQDYEERQAKQEANRIKLQQNPFLTLGDPSLNEWQQFVLARNMLNTPQNVTDPNAVRATHNEQAMRLAERLGFGQGFPEQTPEGKAVADAKAREANPRAAGVRDISEKNYESKEAQIEFDALAKQHDTSYGGFSYDNERALAQRLMGEPYNMPQADAEEYAYRAGEKLRWFWNQGGGKAGTRTDATPPAQRPPFEAGDMPRPGVGPFDRPGAAPRPFG